MMSAAPITVFGLATENCTIRFNMGVLLSLLARQSIRKILLTARLAFSHLLHRSSDMANSLGHFLQGCHSPRGKAHRTERPLGRNPHGLKRGGDGSAAGVTRRAGRGGDSFADLLEQLIGQNARERDIQLHRVKRESTSPPSRARVQRQNGPRCRMHARSRDFRTLTADKAAWRE